MLAASKPAEVVAADVASKALKLLEWLQEQIPREEFQNHDLDFKVAVQDFEMATHRAQQMLKVDLRAAPDAHGDLDTDDEHEPSLSQAISSAISGVNIAVLDTNGDVLEPAVDETERAVVEDSLKDRWVELKTHGGNEVAGQKLVLEWYSTLEGAKTSNPLRAKAALRTTPYGSNTKPANVVNIGTDNNRTENGITPATVAAT